MRFAQTIALVAACAGLAACASTDLTDTTKVDAFSTRVVSADRLEIESSQLALSRSNDPGIKNVAQHMIDDHMKADAQLDSALKASDDDIPPPDLLSYHQHLLTQLQASENFDCDYLGSQWVAHKQALTLFDTYATYGDEPAVRDYAAQTIPTLLTHMQMIEDAEAKSTCVAPKDALHVIKTHHGHKKRHTHHKKTIPIK